MFRLSRLSPVRPMAVLAAGLGAAMLLSVSAAANPPPTATTASPDLAESEPALAESEPDLGESDTGRWVIRLTDPSLAAHLGTSGADAASVAGEAYRDQLARRQDATVASIEDALGRPMEVTHAYRNVLNAIVVSAEPAEAAALLSLPDVDAVHPERVRELDTDASQELIGAPAVWEGDTGPDLPTQGEGVIAGALDSGINPDHPAFAETADDGFTHTNPYGSGEFVGVCDPEHEDHDDMCNDKLIGAWDFTGEDTGARDANGHGSHTASTMAGNAHEVTIARGGEEFTRTVQGTASRANVISYKVCTDTGSCPESAMLAGVDQAVEDGVDVLNFSISGTDDPWNDPVDLAFLEAADAGILVSASAGNTGPGDGTVAKTGPWNASVAATTNGRLIANELEVVGPEPVPPELELVRVWPTDSPALADDLTTEVRYALDEGSSTGCSSYPEGAFEGKTALVRITGSFFDCGVSTKVANPAEAGADAVLLYLSDEQTHPVALGGLTDAAVPAYSVDNVSADALVALSRELDTEPIEAQLGAQTTLIQDGELGNEVAAFSARGPSQFDVLAPTYAAPGVNVLAATAPVDGDPVQHGFSRGTSMAAPHATGAAALLKSLHPDWSAAQLRSALAATADPAGVRLQDGETAAGPLAVGSGRLDLEQAGRVGLVMDETREDFEAANPDEGGDPRALNLPALVDQTCVAECGWIREVTNVADTTVEYHAQVETPDDMGAQVSPAEFTLEPGESQQLEVTVEVTSLPSAEWHFADLRVTTDDAHAGGAPVASSRYPVAVVPVTPVLTLEPGELTSQQRPDREVQRALLVRSEGNGLLEWQIAAEPAGCDDPAELAWLTVGQQDGSVPVDEWEQIRFTLDSTDLAPQELTATLCIASNDPERPLLEVPVTLTVQDLPLLRLDQPELALTQPGGTVAGVDLEIANTGTSALEWEIITAEADAPASEALADVDPERLELLRDGLLLVPDSTSGEERVLAFDPDTGDLVDEHFIPYQEEAGLSVPQHVLLTADQDGFLIANQGSVVHEYNLDGEWQGVFAPAGGQDDSIIRNIRGMAHSPWGTVLVTSALGDNAHAVAEFDQDGNFLGNFVDNGAGGIAGPWYVLFRDDDVLVGGSTSGLIHRYGHDGNPAPNLPLDFGFPAQIVERDNGNLLVAQFSSTAPNGPGTYELDPDGNLLDIHAPTGSNRGVAELANGNLLTSNGVRNPGVHEVDGDTIVDTKYESSNVRMISPVRLHQPCVESEVPWLEVSATDGQTAPGERDSVRVRVDSTGLAAGQHTASVCVASNDPDNELVEVPVSVTVTEPGCDRTITGEHRGALVVNDGLTCIAERTQINGPVVVRSGASLHASGGTVDGPISTSGAEVLQLQDTTINGPVSVRDATTQVVLSGNEIAGPVWVSDNDTGDDPVVMSGNAIRGLLACFGNQPPPTDNGVPNRVTGPVSGQCTDLT